MVYWVFMFNLEKLKKIILFELWHFYEDDLFSAELHFSPFICIYRDIYIHMQINIFKHIREKLKHSLD